MEEWYTWCTTRVPLHETTKPLSADNMIHSCRVPQPPSQLSFSKTGQKLSYSKAKHSQTKQSQAMAKQQSEAANQE
jgi:hypothetical protein